MARISLLLLGLLVTCFSFGQNINFSIQSNNSNPYEGCDVYFLDFQAIISGTATVDSIEMVSSDRSKMLIRNSDWSITGRRYKHQLGLNAGTHNPILRVKLSGSWSEVVLKQSIIVHSEPSANFSITSSSTQCFEGNEFTFQNTSTPSSSNAKLSKIIYDLGDGSIDSKANPTHSYRASGTYDVILTVVDEKGCSDTRVVKKAIEVKKPVGADFRLTGPIGCETTKVSFSNTSQVATADVTGWDWHWEPGVVQTFTSTDIASHWANYDRTYTKDGFFSPKLVVHTSYGCSDSVTLINAVSNKVTPEPDFTADKTGPICVGDSVQFTLKDTGAFEQILWVFGDPLSLGANINRTERNPVHQYNTPGSYPVSLTLQRRGCLAKDTTICCIHVNGPLALINLSIPFTKEVYSKGELEYMNSHPNYKPSVQQISYNEKTPGKHYLGGLMNTFETERKFSGNAGPGSVGNYDITLPIIDTYYTYKDSLDYTTVAKTWIRGTPVPKAVMYTTPLSTDPLVHKLLLDTILLADPSKDSLVVDFPNFSIKRRINASFGDNTYNIRAYYDDYPSFNGYHPTYNPSYPFASDSLTFFWDFDDDAAPTCTSTVSTPNPYCKYSTEKLPRHIYKSKGCFRVALTATDPVVGCSNTAYQTITYTAPNAGFDENLYSEMSWEKQNDLLAKNTPLEGMGIRLEGTGCVGNDVDPYFFSILTDGLEPSCLKNNQPLNISFVGDAELDCSTKVYIRDNNNQIVDSTYRNCSWIDGTTLQLIGNRWSYSLPGWKTIGIVVHGANFSKDTFFYKDYIYLPDPNVNFSVENISPVDSLSQTGRYHTAMLSLNNRERDSIIKANFTITKTAHQSGEEINVALKKDSLQLLSNNLVDFTDTIEATLSPGKYVFSSQGQNKRGCIGAQAREVIVGHLSNFRVKPACSGLPTTFVDSVFYWDKRGNSYCQIVNWWTNTTCIDTTNFFKKPDAARDKWVQKVPNYQLPKFKEQIAWDYDNDGTIDDVNPVNPSFTYQQPGVYTCAMWTMDSTGQWLKSTKTFTVKGISISASLASGQSTYLCTPTQRTINYQAQVFGDSNFTVSTPTKWFSNQKTGSFTQQFNNRAPYALQLSARTSSGCTDTLVDSNFFTFIGPRAAFEIATDTICPGENLKATNTGSVTGNYEWRIASASSSTALIETSRDLDINLSDFGLHKVSLTTSEEVTDPQTNQKVTCTAVYPQDNPAFVRNIESLYLQFEISGRLSNERVSFDILDFDNGRDYSYRINGSQVTIPKGSNGLFTAQFPGKGDYSICLYANDSGCVDSTCLNTWVDDHVGLGESQSETVQVFPNPAQSEIFVQGLKPGTRYELSNLLGKTFIQGTTNSQLISLPVSELNNGVYLLTLESSGTQHTQKVVIKH